MDIDETKKRKIEDVTDKIDLETVLKAHIESSQNMAKLINALTQKILAFEKVFNQDLFKQSQ